MVIKENFSFLFIHKHMNQKDKRILIESITLTVIYLLSFGILSLGRVPQNYFFMSELAFSSLQILLLVFIFAVVIARVMYFVYQEKIQ